MAALKWWAAQYELRTPDISAKGKFVSIVPAGINLDTVHSARCAISFRSRCALLAFRFRSRCSVSIQIPLEGVSVSIQTCCGGFKPACMYVCTNCSCLIRSHPLTFVTVIMNSIQTLKAQHDETERLCQREEPKQLHHTHGERLPPQPLWTGTDRRQLVGLA
jgi:hypothetical protein